ncbi:MAG: hypothetical protein FWG74_07720 [Planctomycetes bacterium]|nr:hypothetical protein [Planctomycetota bacterium]
MRITDNDLIIHSEAEPLESGKCRQHVRADVVEGWGKWRARREGGK